MLVFSLCARTSLTLSSSVKWAHISWDNVFGLLCLEVLILISWVRIQSSLHSDSILRVGTIFSQCSSHWRSLTSIYVFGLNYLYTFLTVYNEYLSEWLHWLILLVFCWQTQSAHLPVLWRGQGLAESYLKEGERVVGIGVQANLQIFQHRSLSHFSIQIESCGLNSQNRPT